MQFIAELLSCFDDAWEFVNERGPSVMQCFPIFANVFKCFPMFSNVLSSRASCVSETIMPALKWRESHTVSYSVLPSDADVGEKEKAEGGQLS